MNKFRTTSALIIFCFGCSIILYATNIKKANDTIDSLSKKVSAQMNYRVMDSTFFDSVIRAKDLEIEKMRKKLQSHGMASFYAGKFIGRKTANGEIYTAQDFTCAHNHYRFGTKLRVTNLRNRKSVIVRVNDRGRFNKYGRILDLSKLAFTHIANPNSGVIKVKIEVV